MDHSTGAFGVLASHSWGPRLNQQAKTFKLACEPGYQAEEQPGPLLAADFTSKQAEGVGSRGEL